MSTVKLINGKINFVDRPLSWSNLSSWWWDQEEWYRRYVLGEKQPDSPAMDFGKKVHEQLQVGQASEHVKIEYKLSADIHGIPCIAYCDGWNTQEKRLTEIKTSANENRWNQESVDRHEQITMYFLMLQMQEGITPENCSANVVYVPVEQLPDFSYRISGRPQIFETRRTTEDILKFANKIKRTVREMERFMQKQQ